jgi:hydroxyethylthiazole kinase
MEIYSYLEAVRKKKPLVHHITNWVTINDCAQVVKTFGASPVMAHAPEEVADMAGMASALVLNIGTLTSEFIESMKIAAKSANQKKIPVVLDVCGAGATPFRDKKCMELIQETRIDIIKGNGSEIARIAGKQVKTKGVDTTEVDDNLKHIAADTAKTYKCTVVITGKDDFISDGKRTFIVSNGDEMMSHVVGTGCMAASVIGAFAGASPADITGSAAAGLSCYGIAAELAVKEICGPGTFKEKLFDCIFHLDEETINSMQRVSV